MWLLAALIGIVQIGQLLYAGAEVRGVVGDAARLVKTNSDMSEDALQAYINSRVHSTGTIKIGTPTLQSGTTESGAKYRTIDLSYTVQLDFVFFSTDPITIDASRRVYVF